MQQNPQITYPQITYPQITYPQITYPQQYMQQYPQQLYLPTAPTIEQNNDPNISIKFDPLTMPNINTQTIKQESCCIIL